MDDTPLTKIKAEIKPENETPDDSSLGSEIVYAVTEPTFIDIDNDHEGEDHELHVLREDPRSNTVAEADPVVCKIQVRKVKGKQSRVLPDIVSEEEESTDALLDGSEFLNAEIKDEAFFVEAVVTSPRKKKKKKAPTSPPKPHTHTHEEHEEQHEEHAEHEGAANAKAKSHCRFCISHDPVAKRGRKRGRKGSRANKCRHCSVVLVDAEERRAHERSHGPVSHRFKCRYCVRTFPMSSNLKDHERTHTGERPYKCQYCPKGFTTSGGARIHERSHTGERPFKCKQCKKGFATSGVLRAHVRYHHTGEKPFECKICAKAFVESGHLRRHERIHADNRTLHLHKDMYFVL